MTPLITVGHRAIDNALEPLGVLIALRKAPPEVIPPGDSPLPEAINIENAESFLSEKRIKRPRTQSPPSVPVPVVTAPSTQSTRSGSIAIPPRSSVGPQTAVPFSREPRARREALAKQLPLEKGRKVAFHPPQNTKGAESIVSGKDEEWILAVVTKCINQDKNR